MPKTFTFTDSTGDAWEITSGYQTLQAIEQELGVSFADSEQTPALMRIVTDWLFAYQAVEIACRQQREDRGLSAEDFSDRIAGDTLADAQRGLVDAVIEFLPWKEKREATRETVRQIQAADKLMAEQASKRLADLDLDKLTDDMIAATRS
ncbi:MAG: hypothetical protein AAF593_00720 [Planctomycetota bacterium]